MKYSIVLAPFLALASAQSVARQVVDGLVTDANSLTTTINAYNGGDGADLRAKSAQVVDNINSGRTRINAAPELTQGEAIDLASGVGNLGTAVKNGIDALVGKKPTLVSSGQGPAAYSALLAQQSASAQLSTDLTAKVPEGLRGTASQLAAPIAAAFSSGVAAFADQASATASESGSATASASSSATSVASSVSASSTASGSSSASRAASSLASSVSSVVASASSSVASATSASATSARPSQTGIATGAADKVALTGGAALAAALAVLAL